MHTSTDSFRFFALVVLMSLMLASNGRAQTGVSDDRVALPDGPGSIEGLGDNAEAGGSRGAMSYRVPLAVPSGYRGLTPSVDLSYSSLAGSGILGIGWSMETPSIERLTLRGLPSYDADDEFSVMGSEQLVRVSGGANAVYRARFEGGYVRYTFHGAGAEGYWEAEYPNGQRAYFGADAGGNLVADARLSGERGTFRYLLVERVDLYGHHIRYSYETIDGRPYCERVAYGPPQGEGDRYEIAMSYERRPDVLSDAKPGFEERTTQRLTDVEVFVRGLVIRRYGLTYEDTEVAGGLSRLASVERFGRDGTRHPIRFTFGYERALSSNACGDATACEPHVVDMGTVPGGANFVTGATTLADLNGDALPDLVDTSRPGAHRIFLSEMMEGDATRFASEVASATGTQSAFDVRRQNVQVLDINGDGFTDLVNLRTSSALCNLGTGDWVTDGSCEVSGATGIIPVATSSDADPTRFRFVDMDSDRRIDLVHTPNESATLFYRNTEDGFVLQPGADAIGRVFDVDRLFLSDVNADGLLDALLLGDTGVASYKLNLGQGRWEETFRRMDGPLVGSGDLSRLVFEDLNNDGRDDMVLVLTNEVRFALNRNGERFDANAVEAPSGPVFGVLSRDDVPDLPTRGTDTTVLFADMNGNGTRDIVWVERTGEARYVELFATPPNLISRIENSLGSVQELAYTTSVAERRRSVLAGLPEWTLPMPMSMNVVARMDIWEELTGDENGVGLHDITEFAYENGFYDGIEKQFRGFVQVTAHTLPDPSGDTQEQGRRVEHYDVGEDDPYRAGKLLIAEDFSGERALRRSETTYEDCPVAEVPNRGLRFPVRHVCETEARTTSMEGRPEDEWRTQQVVQTYNGYGQVIRTDDSGFLELDGDETVNESDYIEPGDATGGRWILDRASAMRRSGGDELQTETRHFYDGEPFVGLESGRLTTGLLTRVTERIASESDAVIQSARRRFDAHGNEIESITPRGSEADTDEHRTRFLYDDDGFLLRAQEIAVRSPEGDAYLLRRERSYDDSFDLPVEATAWMVVQGGETLTPRNPTRLTYNEFMELTARFQPGDPVDAPSVEYIREYGAPVTAFRTRTRSTRGGSPDLETVLCQDGRGRAVQTRRRTGADSYQVSGFSEYNSRGAVVRAFRPFVGAGGACDRSAPEDVLFTTTRYDALGRVQSQTLPDEADYGTATVSRTEYRPGAVLRFDGEDADPSSPHANTPTTVVSDGRGLMLRIERELVAGQPIVSQSAEYDSLGRLVALMDEAGNRKEQAYDLLGRVVEIDDPNSGFLVMEYNDAGEMERRTDGRGFTTRFAYDALGRRVAEWDENREAETRVEQRYDFVGSCDAARCTNTATQLVEVRYPAPAFVPRRSGGGAEGIRQFGYDARGQLIFAGHNLGGVVGITRHEYDNANRRVSTTHPDGRTVLRGFDGASRMVSHSGFLSATEFTPEGLVAELAYTNGVRDSWEYDSQLRPARQQTLLAGGSAIRDVETTYDRAGNALRVTDDAAGDGWDPLNVRLTQDAWYRMTDLRDERDEGDHAMTFAYDRLGNFTELGEERNGEMDLREVAFESSRPNAVTRVGDLAYRYDDSGYLVERGDLQFEWDHFGRLVRVTRAGEAVLQLGYASGPKPTAIAEAGGLTLHISPDFEVRDGLAVSYDRFAATRAARHESTSRMTEWLGDPNGDGRVSAHDAWQMFRDGGEGERARVTLRGAARRLLVERSGGDAVSIVLHRDRLDDLVGATDASGELRGRARYALMTGADQREGYVDRYGFCGQEEYAELGLTRHQHRWLDAHSRRWTQPDPLFRTVASITSNAGFQATNPYGYVDGAYGTANDPSGLISLRGIGRSIRRGVRRLRSAAGRAFRRRRGRGRARANSGASAASRASNNDLRVSRLVETGTIGGQRILRRQSNTSANGTGPADFNAAMQEIARFQRTEVRDSADLSSIGSAPRPLPPLPPTPAGRPSGLSLSSGGDSGAQRAAFRDAVAASNASLQRRVQANRPVNPTQQALNTNPNVFRRADGRVDFLTPDDI